jgi:hypothetical protein
VVEVAIRSAEVAGIRSVEAVGIRSVEDLEVDEDLAVLLVALAVYFNYKTSPDNV